ncbi:MAG: CRISPR-associated endonuclease Cas2 2 [bacterium ADurb.Bin157]|jgi:CRISPR-associated protein Cas2|nr:MAG: CRISPR-associated endonuclease Cas2 2 [bacterium ADurb.Bin157]
MSGEFYIICYDSPSNKRRTKLHKLLKNYAVAVQKSVFETFLDKPTFNKMMAKIELLMNTKEDSVRIYGMTRQTQKQVKIIGYPGILLDPNYYFIAGSQPDLFNENGDLNTEEEDLPEWL